MNSSHQSNVHVLQEKQAKKIDKKATFIAFRRFIVGLMIAHLVVYCMVADDGLPGYIKHVVQLAEFLINSPVFAISFIASFPALYHGIHLWRHRNDAPDEVEIPPYPPIPYSELLFTNDVYIGSGSTYDGKQPGEKVTPEEIDSLLPPHLYIREKGLFGNMHCLGGVGGGKTSTLILPFIDQAVAKFPRPMPPSHFKLAPDGRFPVPQREVKRDLWKDRFIKKVVESPIEEWFNRSTWNPYFVKDQQGNVLRGMNMEEAEREYERLTKQHEERKWGMFIIDPKGDISKFVLQCGVASGRENDVIVLRPDGEFTYNPLLINTNPLVMAEMVMDGIEAVAGQSIQMYWRNTQSEWLANALNVLKTASPAKVNFRTILTMAREEAMRSRWVAEAEAELRRAQDEEARAKHLGRQYKGPRVNPSAIEFFRDFDDVEADAQAKRAVVSGIKAQAKYFVDEDLVNFLCPELPPTFDGFEQMIDKGLVVVLRMPLDSFGPVARVMGILMLADAQQAARVRINRPEMNAERVVAFVVDECSAYLNRLTKEFIAMNRQSRVVCVFAHQTLGQLIQNNDKSFETSFNDNLRTKISYSAPNAEAARRVSSLFGSRTVQRSSTTIGTSLQGVQHTPSTISAKGNEGASVSVRLDEIDKAWFDAAAVLGLQTGECIVSEFDGISTQTPRKVLAPALYLSPRGAYVMGLPCPEMKVTPHPWVILGSKNGDEEYLNIALSQTGFVFVESLYSSKGIMKGLKFVTGSGTIIVPEKLITQGSVSDYLSERLDDNISVILTDLEYTPFFLQVDGGVRFDKVIPLPYALQNTKDENGMSLLRHMGVEKTGTLSFSELFQLVLNVDMGYKKEGSWEYHTNVNDKNRRDLIQESRRFIKLYVSIGDKIEDLGMEILDDIYENMKPVVEKAVEDYRGNKNDSEEGNGTENNGGEGMENNIENFSIFDLSSTPQPETGGNRMEGRVNYKEGGLSEASNARPSDTPSSYPSSDERSSADSELVTMLQEELKGSSEKQSSKVKKTKKSEDKSISTSENTSPLFEIDDVLLAPDPFSRPTETPIPESHSDEDYPEDSRQDGNDFAGSDFYDPDSEEVF